MIEVYAYYYKSDEFSAHRIIKVGLMKGSEAMYFKGESVSCTKEIEEKKEIKEGWYYDEKSRKFMTEQEFDNSREKYRISPAPSAGPTITSAEDSTGSEPTRSH